MKDDRWTNKDIRHKTSEKCRGMWLSQETTEEAIQYVASKSTGSAKQEINLVVIGPNYSCFDINQVLLRTGSYMHGSPEVPVEMRPIFTAGSRSTNKVIDEGRRGRKRPDTTRGKPRW